MTVSNYLFIVTKYKQKHYVFDEVYYNTQQLHNNWIFNPVNLTITSGDYQHIIFIRNIDDVVNGRLNGLQFSDIIIEPKSVAYNIHQYLLTRTIPMHGSLSEIDFDRYVPIIQNMMGAYKNGKIKTKTYNTIIFKDI